MIDFGIYKIKKDPQTGKFHIYEQFENREFICDNIFDVSDTILNELDVVNRSLKNEG